VRFTIDGPATDLDLGAVGVNFDTSLPQGLEIVRQAACTADCSACRLEPAAHRERRCLGDVGQRCTGDDDCGGSRCIELFGPPIPLNAGGVPSCLLIETTSVGSGELVPASGAASLTLGLEWRLLAGLDPATPCPICDGSGVRATGSCRGGPRDGAACRVDAVHPLLGATSYDCPPHPESEIGRFDFGLALTTGATALSPDHTCVFPPFAGSPCFCPDQPIANTCVGGRCEEDGDGDGVCIDGPGDGLCALEAFRGCRVDADCPAAGDGCVFHHRECLGSARESLGVTASLRREGRADGDAATLVALGCVSAATTQALNAGIGLPAALSLRMPVTIVPEGPGCDQ